MNFSKTGFVAITASFLAVFLSASILLNSCNTGNSNQKYQLTGDTIKDGKNLVQLHCTGCHKLVSPDELTKEVWKFHALPSMAHYLGISTYGSDYFKNNLADTSGLSLLEWQAIVSYYKKTAPDSLVKSKPPRPLLNDWGGFVLKKPAASERVAFTTMVAVNPYDHKIYSADGDSEQLFDWDKNLHMHITAKLPSPAVQASFIKDKDGSVKGVFSCIGQLEPMDFPNGRVVQFDLNSKSKTPSQSLVASELARPVQSIAGDFNKDGLTDWVICGQGGKQGGVYLLKQNPDHTFSQSNIVDKAGAVQAVTGDFNNDGWPDLMVLFGSGDEGLWMFLNNKKGGFTSKNLLRFPPVYGSTSFQLTDINHDGKPDLIYTCGYNFHDSRILKPYHGLYIFTNQGNWQFKQSYFYPINGCTKAIAADFDGDGDMDIATIAFFADLKGNPAEGFIYFEQDKALNFKPHALPVSKYGRWMSMDVSDVNNDGKPDIILGNYSHGFMFQPGLKPFWDDHTPLIVLQNNIKKL